MQKPLVGWGTGGQQGPSLGSLLGDGEWTAAQVASGSRTDVLFISPATTTLPKVVLLFLPGEQRGLPCGSEKVRPDGPTQVLWWQPPDKKGGKMFLKIYRREEKRIKSRWRRGLSKFDSLGMLWRGEEHSLVLPCSETQENKGHIERKGKKNPW